MTTVAIYASAFGARADLSIAAQLDSCRRYAARLGHSAPAIFVDRERAESGGPSDGVALFRACAAGEIDMIIVVSRRRLERAPEGIATSLESAAEQGVTVRFVDEELGLLPDAI